MSVDAAIALWLTAYDTNGTRTLGGRETHVAELLASRAWWPVDMDKRLRWRSSESAHRRRGAHPAGVALDPGVRQVADGPRHRGDAPDRVHPRPMRGTPSVGREADQARQDRGSGWWWSVSEFRRRSSQGGSERPLSRCSRMQ